MAGKMTMSLEAALEEERQEIENLILQQTARGPSGRSPSPYMSPRSPVRSMLDVEGVPSSGAGNARSPAQPAFRSMLDIDAPAAVPVRRSMLDVSTPPPSASSRYQPPSSAHTSPTLSTHRAQLSNTGIHHRSASDAASKPVADFGPRSPLRERNDITSAYQFSDIYATNVGQAQPVRRAGPSIPRSSSIGEALRGADLSNLVLPGEGRKPFSLKGNNSKSKSPNNRFSLRSSSPGGTLLGNPASRRQSQGSYVFDKEGQAIDMNTAYRRLSDANLAFGGSNLASYARKKSETDGHGRLQKLNMSPYGEILTDDDSDDDGPNTSDEEDQRGRKLTTRADSHDKAANGEPKSAKSLLAAAEDERKQVAAQPQYRSLFEPAITVTGPGGGKPTKPSKQSIHPATSFDQEPLSGQQTPNQDQEAEDVHAIKAAQNLQISFTPVISTPEAYRSIRIIYRGEYVRIQRDAEDEHRRLRKYLVAIDLSDESTHALEWAVGTVLRDGDTLIAIYCMDEEATGAADNGNNQVPDDLKSMREQAAVINAMAKSPKLTSQTGSPNPFHLQRSPYMKSPSASNNPSPAPSSRGKPRMAMAEDRERAAQDITDRVSRLLRKTQLQVRVIVEVIHCKSPKHLITEVIDIVNPTLVILGSRGRSALKGTLLGSFSNYLVTKSSVPVMVARKRLRKKSKYQPPPTKQINNLSNPSARSLQMARVD